MAFQKDIVVYLPTWRPNAYLDIDMTAITRIAYSFCWLEKNGTFAVEGWQYDPDTLITAAHAAGVKVVMAIRDRESLPLVLNTTLSGASVTSVVSSTAIPVDTAASGILSLLTYLGVCKVVAYTSYTGSTFTIPSTNFTGANTVTLGSTILILPMDKFLANTGLQTTFINAVAAEVTARGYDGVDTDLEVFTGSIYKTAFTTFQAALTTKIRTDHPGAVMSMAFGADVTSASRERNALTNYDFVALDPYIDYFFLMGYDWYGNWGSDPIPAGPNAPWVLDYDVIGWAEGDGNYNTLTTVIALVDRNKVIMGVPWYGKAYTVDSDIKWATKTTGTGVPNPGYADYINLVSSSVGTPTFDFDWGTKYYSYDAAMVENPGFEVDSYGWIETQGTETPDGFDPYYATSPHAGTYCGKIHSATIDGKNRYFAQIIYGITASHAYTVEAWIKTDSIVSTDAYTGGAIFNFAFYNEGTGSGWTYLGERYARSHLAATSIGTCTFTNGDATVTGTNFWGTWPVGRLLKLDSTDRWYTGASVINDTTMELTETYAGTTATGAASYTPRNCIQGTHGWTKINDVITSPAGATLVEIQLTLLNSSGTVYWDDIIFDTSYSAVHKQLHYEDTETLGLKYDNAIAMNLGGVGTWDASKTGGATDALWQQFKDRFSGIDNVYVDTTNGDDDHDGTAFTGTHPIGAKKNFVFGYTKLNSGGTLHVASGDYSTQLRNRYKKHFYLSPEDPNTTGAKNVKIPSSI